MTEAAITRDCTDARFLALALLIVTQADAEGAAQLRAGIRELMKRVEDTFDPIISDAHKAHKTALAKKAEHFKPLEEALRQIDAKLSRWIAEQDAARKQKILADEAAAVKREEDRRLQAAADMADAGEHAEADRLLVQPIVVSVEAPAAAKVKGVAAVALYHGEVTDAKLLPREYLVPDYVKINAVVRALKDSANIPGVRVVKSLSMR